MKCRRSMTPILITLLISLLIIGIAYAIFFTTVMPGHSYTGSRSALTLSQQKVHDGLQTHVDVLAHKIGERNMWNYPQLLLAAEYIEQRFTEYNYSVEYQSFNVMGKEVRNIIAELPGKSHPEEVVVIGAHYDSVSGSPGANDNGTGVAAMLEMTRLLASQELPRTIRFIGFVNEEPPFSYSAEMGSYVAAKLSKENDENIIAMFSLETIGYYSDQAHSQTYPMPLNLFYPNTGKFLAFVADIKSRSLARQSIKIFREHTEIPSEGLVAPRLLGAINLSDHWSYWNQGYKALMVTDTAMFRYPYYHTNQDTKDKIDYARLTKVTLGLTEVVQELARHGVSMPDGSLDFSP